MRIVAYDAVVVTGSVMPTLLLEFQHNSLALGIVLLRSFPDLSYLFNRILLCGAAKVYRSIRGC